jgi:mannose-1-phosphate guanylyltransferase
MERTHNLVAVEGDFAWSDLGSWEDVAAILPQDAGGNAVMGELVAIESSDNVVVSDGVVALVGVADLVVVQAGGAILVCPRARVQEVKALVAELRRRGRDDLL